MKLSCHRQMVVRFSVLPADVTVPKAFWTLDIISCLCLLHLLLHLFLFSAFTTFFFDNMSNIHYIFIPLTSEIGLICID